MKAIFQPAFMAVSVGALLYAYNPRIDISKLEAAAWLPFWAGVARPTGIVWNRINKRIAVSIGLPNDMQRFKELFLVSTRAVLLDLFQNQVVYHIGLAMFLYSYTYAVRKYVVDRPPSQSALEILQKIGPELLRTRMLLAVTSIASEYWGSYLSLKNLNGRVSIPNGTKRLLLIKQHILSVVWYAYCLHTFYANF